MNKIAKKILVDEEQRPVAVLIDYGDWLELERELGLPSEQALATDLDEYRGILEMTEDALDYQHRVRDEWP